MVVGREWGGLAQVDDRPEAGLGPLGGLAGALAHAAGSGFDAVLCAPCDTLGLGPDLARRLSPPPAVVRGQWLVGLWPAACAPALFLWLAHGRSRRVQDWARHALAREVAVGGLANLNRPPR